MQQNNNPNIFQALLQTLFVPQYFFSHLSTDPYGSPIKNALWHYAAYVLFFYLLRAFSTFFFIGSYFKVIGYLTKITIPVPQLDIFSLILNSLLTVPIVLSLSFVMAAVLHMYCKIMGSKMPYYKSYQLFVYSRVPSIALGWIPFLAFFTWIYTLLMLIIGTEQLHKFSKKKAVFMYLIPAAIIFIFIILIMAVFLNAFANMPAIPSV